MTPEQLLIRAEIFKKLTDLFDFDEKGHLYPLAPGMAGKIDMPLGYCDLSKIPNQNLTGGLMLAWYDGQVAFIMDPKNPNGKREATNEELEIAYNYYSQAMKDYRNERIEYYEKKGIEMSPYVKSQLGIIPFLYKEYLKSFFSLKK